MKKKPVVEVDENTMWDYEYRAMRHLNTGIEALASDSLINLKREVRNRGWKTAWIAPKTGCMSYGQNLVDEYPYVPR